MADFNVETLTKLRTLMKDNPDVYSMITGKKQMGRPKGAVNKETLQAGSKLEVIEKAPESYDEIQEEPISLTKAKAIIKANRKPRQYSEETKAKMLENLAKGREKRKLELEARKKNPVEQAKKQVVQGAVVKKYVIKSRKPATKRPVQEDESVEEASESEEEIIKKLTKKQRLMQKLHEMEQMQLPKPAPVAQSRPRQYSLFYH